MNKPGTWAFLCKNCNGHGTPDKLRLEHTRRLMWQKHAGLWHYNWWGKGVGIDAQLLLSPGPLSLSRQASFSSPSGKSSGMALKPKPSPSPAFPLSWLSCPTPLLGLPVQCRTHRPKFNTPVSSSMPNFNIKYWSHHDSHQNFLPTPYIYLPRGFSLSLAICASKLRSR